MRASSAGMAEGMHSGCQFQATRHAKTGHCELTQLRDVAGCNALTDFRPQVSHNEMATVPGELGMAKSRKLADAAAPIMATASACPPSKSQEGLQATFKQVQAASLLL